MAGIYIHIPFCRHKCHYCNFYSLATKKYRSEFLKGLLQEVALRKNYLGPEVVNTIYFGGGTPSLFEVSELDELLTAIDRHFSLGPHPEITLEANPDDLHPQTIRDLKKSRFNRLSIGIQSFHQKDLEYLNRVHSAEQAKRAVKQSQDAGLNRISIDLIYGMPTLSQESWEKNIKMFFDLELPHLSAYSLTVEPGTPLVHLIRNGKTDPPDEESAIVQFRWLMETMRKNVFNHYEISNFCRNDQVSLHNTNYWKGVPYLGLGPSAHSFNGQQRHWNAASLKAYISGMERGEPAVDMEHLSGSKRYNEYIMLSLRTMWGTDLETILDRFGEAYKDAFVTRASKHLQRGLMYRKKDIFYLTDEGKLFADGISADLFLD